MFPNTNTDIPIIGFDGDIAFNNTVVPAGNTFAAFSNLSFGVVDISPLSIIDNVGFVGNLGSTINGSSLVFGSTLINPNHGDDNPLPNPVVIDFSGNVLCSQEAYSVIPVFGYQASGVGQDQIINARMLPIAASTGTTTDSAEYVSFYNRFVIDSINIPSRDLNYVVAIALVNYSGSTISSGQCRFSMQARVWTDAITTFNPQK